MCLKYKFIFPTVHKIERVFFFPAKRYVFNRVFGVIFVCQFTECTLGGILP